MRIQRIHATNKPMTIPAIAPADRLEDDELSVIIAPVDNGVEVNDVIGELDNIPDSDIAELAVDGVVSTDAADDELTMNELGVDDELTANELCVDGAVGCDEYDGEDDGLCDSADDES